MAKRINWQYANVRDKVYNTEEIKYDWRQLKAIADMKCGACQRRIKKHQRMLWNVNTKDVMHVPEDCKLW